MPVKSSILWAYAMMAPALAVAGILLFLPAARTLQLSVTQETRTPASATAEESDEEAEVRALRFAGISHYRHAFYGEGDAGATYGHTARIALVFVPPCVLAGMLIALLVRRTGKWAPAFYRLFLLVSLIGTVSATLIGYSIFHLIPGEAQPWFSAIGPPPEGQYARPIIPFAAAVCGWQYLGVAVAIFAMGLRSLPAAGYDMARLDGATGSRAFCRITMPGLGASVVLALIAGLVVSMRMFAQVFLPAGGEHEARLYSVLSHLYIYAFGPANRTGVPSALLAFWGTALFGIGLLCWFLNNMQRRYAAEAGGGRNERDEPGASRAAVLLASLVALIVLGPVVPAFRSMARPPAAGTMELAQFLPSVWNSALVAAASAFLAVLAGSLAAFPICYLSFPGRKWIAAFFILLAFMPGELALIGQCEIIAGLGLNSTPLGLIISHTSLALPVCVLVVAGAFWKSRGDLAGQSAMDGCTPFGAWLRVLIPARFSVLLFVFVIAAISSWNEFLFALALSRSQDWSTLPVKTFLIFKESGLCWPILVLVMVSIVPAAIAARFVAAGLASAGSEPG